MNSFFEDIVTAVKRAHFTRLRRHDRHSLAVLLFILENKLTLLHGCAIASRREECCNTSSTGTNALGECTLRHKVQLNLAVEELVTDFAVATQERSSDGLHHPTRTENTDTMVGSSKVVRENMKVLKVGAFRTFVNECARNATQTKTTDHDLGTRLNISHSSCRRHDLATRSILESH